MLIMFLKHSYQTTITAPNSLHPNKTRPEITKHLSCSTQLSRKFQVLIKTKKNKQILKCFTLSLSDVVFIMLINVKMPTIVGILTFMSRINFVLDQV